MRTAFLWKWNLLALAAGVGFGLLSPAPDMVLPLVGAAEVAYLGFLCASERFRKAVAAQGTDVPKEAAGVTAPTDRMRAMYGALPDDDREQYETLRAKVKDMLGLARRQRLATGVGEDSLSGMRVESLNKLLWMFLQILSNRDTLRAFVRDTDRNAMASELKAAEQDLEKARTDGKGEKMIQSLADTVETMRQRLKNHEQARENLEFLDAEIRRLEQKVQATSEMALNARNAEEISVRVDSIASGVAATEEALRGIEGVSLDTESAPPPMLAA